MSAISNLAQYLRALAGQSTVLPANSLQPASMLPAYVGAFASAPAATSLAAGIPVVFTDLPTAGCRSWWYSNGTNYKPCAPTTVAKKTGLTSGAIQTADQVIGQLPALPLGLLTNQTFCFRFSLGRNNNVDAYSGSVNLRVGTAGTTADTAISTLNISSMFTAAGGSLSFGCENWSRMTSATAGVKLGRANAAGSFQDSAGSGSALLTTFGVVNADANALIFSLSTAMVTATTTTPQTGDMELIIVP